MTVPNTVLQIGVLRETEPGEGRVALTPDGVTRLAALGLEVVVESHAGAAAGFPDDSYAAVGATVLTTAAVVAQSDLLVCLHPPGGATVGSMRPGQTVVGLLQPLVDLELVGRLSAAQVTALSLDALPRTISSAQSMDALTSQANVAGYKAAVLAADTYGGFFPMLMTAAGTVRPAKVLVLGAGVAGLQAIGTARRLGAVVTAYDVRADARDDVASTGAAFLDLGIVTTGSDASDDGYARRQSADEQSRLASAMVAAIGSFDIVISTAKVPGRMPPVLVSGEAVAAMSPGSVVLDLASGPLGGNVEGSVPGTTIVTAGDVTVIGAGDLAARMPRAASTAYARNIVALLGHLVVDGRLVLDRSDPITAGVLVTERGVVVQPAVLARISELDPSAQLAPTG